jgi:DNA (cytosine-5)-methyltransferase 1
MALGFEQAGFDTVCAVEFDPAHAAAHRFNFPNCEVLQVDASVLSVARLKRGVSQGLSRFGRADRKVDVVFGGPPCQGFSVGGLGDPNDPRNELIRDFARLIKGLRPRAFVLENVPAMASRVLAGTEEAVPLWLAKNLEPDYVVGKPEVFNASAFGVPQDRRRLVIVGVRRSEHIPDNPVATHTARIKVPRSAARGDCKNSGLPLGPSVWEAIGDLPDLERFEELLMSDRVTIPIKDRKEIREAASQYAEVLAGFQEDEADFSWARRRSPSTLTSSLRTTHTPEVRRRFAGVAQGEADPVSRFFRLHPDGICPTLRAGSTPDRGSYSAPRPIHPHLDRVISVREAARLHGYPDWFRFSAAKWHGFRQVGNSVCPPFARVIAASLRESLEEPARKPDGRLSLGEEDLLRVPSGAGRRAAGRRSATKESSSKDSKGLALAA